MQINLDAGTGQYQLYIQEGQDILYVQDGNDSLIGDSRKDTLYGRNFFPNLERGGLRPDLLGNKQL